MKNLIRAIAKAIDEIFEISRDREINRAWAEFKLSCENFANTCTSVQFEANASIGVEYEEI